MKVPKVVVADLKPFFGWTCFPRQFPSSFVNSHLEKSGKNPNTFIKAFPEGPQVARQVTPGHVHLTRFVGYVYDTAPQALGIVFACLPTNISQKKVDTRCPHVVVSTDSSSPCCASSSRSNGKKFVVATFLDPIRKASARFLG